MDVDKISIMYYNLTFFFTGFVLMVLAFSHLPVVRGTITIVGFSILMLSFLAWLLGEWLVQFIDKEFLSAALLAANGIMVGCDTFMLALGHISLVTFAGLVLCLVAITLLSLSVYGKLKEGK